MALETDELPPSEYEPIKAWVTVVGVLVPKEVANEIDLTMQHAQNYFDCLSSAIEFERWRFL